MYKIELDLDHDELVQLYKAVEDFELKEIKDQIFWEVVKNQKDNPEV